MSPEAPPSKAAKGSSRKVKGETRITVSCAEIEALVFGARHDPEKAFGRKKNRAPRGVPEPKEWKSVDMEDKDDASESMHPKLSTFKVPISTLSNNSFTDPQTNHLGSAEDLSMSSETESDTSANGHADMISLRVRPAQSESEVNGSIGGEKGWAEKIEETAEMLQKRREGQKRADERESVRCAARRLCAFGVVVDGLVGGEDGKDKGAKGKGKGKGNGNGNGKGKGKGKEIGKGGIGGDDDSDGRTQEHRKKCEAVMSGIVVEASYAKGEWGIRWRE